MKGLRSLVIRLPTAVCLFASLVQPSGAQIASGGDTVLFRTDVAGTRIEPQFQNAPLTLGPIEVSLALTARTVVDDNVFRTPQSVGSDVFAELTPALRLGARFGPHSAGISARGSVRRYARFPSENRSDIDINYFGRLALGARSSAGWRTTFSRDVEPRGSVGAERVDASPTVVQRLEANASASTEIARAGISASVQIGQRTHFPLVLANGVRRDQSFRDVHMLRIAPRLSRRIGPALSVFVSGSASRTRSIDRSVATLRDADGYTLLAGVRSDTRGLVVGEVGVGWRQLKYRSPAFRDFGGVFYDATVDWYPTQFVSLRVQAGQDIVNSNLPGVAGIVRRSVGATVHYDPLRDLRFVLALDRDNDAFREVQVSANTVNTSLTARHQYNRRIDVAVFVRASSKNSSNPELVNGYRSFGAGIAVTSAL